MNRQAGIFAVVLATCSITGCDSPFTSRDDASWPSNRALPFDSAFVYVETALDASQRVYVQRVGSNERHEIHNVDSDMAVTNVTWSSTGEFVSYVVRLRESSCQGCTSRGRPQRVGVSKSTGADFRLMDVESTLAAWHPSKNVLAFLALPSGNQTHTAPIYIHDVESDARDSLTTVYDPRLLKWNASGDGLHVWNYDSPSRTVQVQLIDVDQPSSRTTVATLTWESTILDISAAGDLLIERQLSEACCETFDRVQLSEYSASTGVESVLDSTWVSYQGRYIGNSRSALITYSSADIGSPPSSFDELNRRHGIIDLDSGEVTELPDIPGTYNGFREIDIHISE